MNTRFSIALWSAVLATGFLAADVSAGTAHFTLTETTSGAWDVWVEVTGGDTSGLASYDLKVVDLEPGQNASIAWTQNVLGTQEESTFALRGLLSGNLIQDSVGSTEYSAVNSQFSSANPIYGIGRVSIHIDGADAVGAPDVDLGVPAYLGRMTTPANLLAMNFAPNANLFDSSQSSSSILTNGSFHVTQTVNPIPEPTSLLAMGGGILGILMARRTASRRNDAEQPV